MKTWTTKAVAATALTVVSLLAASGAQATLSYRLSEQAVYDDVADLTWLRDANPNTGLMEWATATNWASNLSIGGVTGWRLPAGPMSDTQSDFEDSEMGNLFYNVLGGQNGDPIDTPNHPLTYGFFSNVMPYYYWSSTPWNANYVWYFDFKSGFQGHYGLINPASPVDTMYAWAVQTGDVGGNPVPTPGTLALLAAGLLGWVGVKRSRHRAGA